MSDSTSITGTLAAATTQLMGHHMPTVALYAVLAVALLCVAIHWHLSKRPEFAQFTLMDALAEPGGRFDIDRTGKSCALVVTTIGFIHLIAINKMSEWYFTGYALAWISAKVWARRDKDEPRPG